MKKELTILAMLTVSCWVNAASMGGVSHYSFYAATPVLQQGTTNTVVLSGTVQGYTAISGVPIGVSHQGIIAFTGAVTGTGKGPQISPTSNMNYTFSKSFVAANDVDYDINENEQVFCSFAAAAFVSQLFTFRISIRQTYWGPPPIQIGDSCTYNILACSTGVPTCRSATPALSFTLGCPSYVKAEYLVVNGTCYFALVFSASGPGICN